MTKLNRIALVLTRSAVVVLVVLGLQGCSISSFTSGWGGMFGGSKKKATGSVSTNDSAQVSQQRLLSAAEADTGGGSLGLANGCPQFVAWPEGRLLTKYEPGMEGNSLGIVYRGEITKTARECKIGPGQIGIRYGFAGKVLLGTRGRDGTVQLPVVVHVTDRDHNKIKSERMTVRVNVQKSNPRGFFSIVKVVKFTIPTGARALDYKLYVAFEQPRTN